MFILNDENFEKEIENAKKPVLVDFWASWCFPCQIMGKILEKLDKENSEFVLAKLNIDEAPLTAQKYGIDSVPTLILFREGKPTKGFVGTKPEPLIRQWLQENLKDETDKVRKLIVEYEDYAKENRFKLNPNRQIVEGIVKGLMEREKRFGKKYCPCRRATGNQEEDKKIICPCVYHRDEIEKNGRCLCGLFVKD